MKVRSMSLACSWRTADVRWVPLLFGSALLCGCVGLPGTGGSGDSGNEGRGDDESSAGDGNGREEAGEDGNDTDASTDGGHEGDTVDDDDGTSGCSDGVPETTQLPRLTRLQYDNTIRDLVGIEGDFSSMLAPDSTGGVDARAWDGYQAAAKAVSEQAMADANARTRLVPCTPTGDGSECARQFIAEFGQRAFRRPLTEEELARFESLYTTRDEITETGSFDETIQLLLRAFLSSPSFLMRAEITETPEGEVFALSGHEIASRLSYMLWDSMPDPELFAAAAAGALSTSDEILAQAQRMLQDPKARAKVAAFHRDYAHMGPRTRWSELSRDTMRYPHFDPSLVPLLSEETERFFDHIVYEASGTFQDLLTTPVGFVNAALAPLYDLDPEAFGDELERVELDPETRSGVFTRAGFLASHSNYDRTSPILRGAFLQKEVLCTNVPPPPPNVEGTPLPTEGLTTNRERVTAQTAPSDCATCHHTVINPTGFALETYDAVGKLQALDNGAPVDSSASVPMDGTFVDVDGPVALMEAIAASPQAQHCYAEKWVEFAYARIPTSEDACTVDMLASRMAAGGYTVLDLVTDLTQSESFRHRAMEDAP